MGMGEEHAAGGAVATGAPEDGLLPDERAAASAQVRGGAAGAPEGGAVRRIGVFCVGNKLMLDDGLGTAVYEELVERYEAPGNVELFFITGADAVYHILQWRESAAIADLARLIAVTRPGYALSEERRALIAERGSFSIDHLEVTALAISSSHLRKRVAAGRSIRYLTMQSVFDYVREHGLYRSAGPQAAEGGA